LLTGRWSGLFAALVSFACFAVFIAAGRLAELLLRTAWWRVLDIALWVVFVWLAVCAAVKCYKRLTR
jgi:hypothetical protein